MNNNKLTPGRAGTSGEPSCVLCVGITPCLQRSLVFDRLQAGHVNRARSVRIGASGKATNAARVLHALGEPCLLLSLVGGFGGRWFRQFLEEEGLAHVLLESEGPTRMCETLMDAANSQVTELVEEMLPPSKGNWNSLREAVARHAAGSSVTLFPGTLPPDADVDAYTSLIRAAQSAGSRVLVDTSGPALVSALSTSPLAVKLNEQELAVTVGRELTSESASKDAMREVAARGRCGVGITRGARPAWWWDGASGYSFAIPPVEVRSPIGSGDAVLAGLATGLRRGRSAPDAFRLGLACGCANARTAWPGELDVSLLAEYEAAIRVEAI